MWTDRKSLYNKLQNLDSMLSEVYRNLDSSAKEKPDISKIQESIRVSDILDMRLINYPALV